METNISPILIPASEYTYKCCKNELAFWAFNQDYMVNLFFYFNELFPDQESVKIRREELKGAGEHCLIVLNCEDDATFDMVKFTIEASIKRNNYEN